MVARLRADHPALDVRVMDGARLTFGDAMFDVVTAGFVLHLLDDPVAALREIRRVLRPGGRLAFTVPGPVPDGFTPGDGVDELFAEFARYLPPGGSMGIPFDEEADLRTAGFTDITATDVRVELPVADPDTYWRWLLTHGTRKFVEDLDEQHRADFHRRVLADLEPRDPLVLRRYAWLYQARV